MNVLDSLSEHLLDLFIIEVLLLLGCAQVAEHGQNPFLGRGVDRVCALLFLCMHAREFGTYVVAELDENHIRSYPLLGPTNEIVARGALLCL